MTALKTNLTDAMGIAASQAGLKLVSTSEGKGFHGAPTAIFELAPLAGIGASRWLNSYAFHVGLSAWVFAAPMAFIVILTLTVTGYRILRAALANPVKSLRTE